MIKHSHANEFRNIMQMKLEALIDRNTWKEVLKKTVTAARKISFHWCEYLNTN
jgi:hypothetical protein